MIKRNDIITIFGGSGFVGKNLVHRLAKTGAKIKVLGSHASNSQELMTTGAIGQIALININIGHKDAVEKAIAGSDYVINLIGIRFERKKTSFESTHIKFASLVAELSAKHNVKRLLHISALGVEKAKTSKYAKSKLAGEKAVLKYFPNATILRPSVIFGPDDSFINLFNWVSKISPFLPLIGGGLTLFQPVYVGDVAEASVKSLELPEKMVCGRVFELGGPREYTFRQILELILETSGRQRILLTIPIFIAKIKAFFLELMPNPLLTRDQIQLLQYNNIVTNGNGLESLDIKPTPMESIIKDYIR